MDEILRDSFCSLGLQSRVLFLLVEQFALVRGLNPFPSWANLRPSLNCTFLICRIFFWGFVVRIEILLITFLVASLWNSKSFPHFYFLLISSSWPLLSYQNWDLLKLEISQCRKEGRWRSCFGRWNPDSFRRQPQRSGACQSTPCVLFHYEWMLTTVTG